MQSAVSAGLGLAYAQKPVSVMVILGDKNGLPARSHSFSTTLDTIDAVMTIVHVTSYIYLLHNMYVK